MEITQLKTLIHVADLGSLSKAADRLNIAQPALSRQIKLLEAELGVALFERHGRGMVITPEGKDVLEHAARVMAELEGIRACTARDRSALRGSVSIGVPPTVAEIATVPLARRIRDTHPRLEIRFSSAFSGHLTDWLQRGELDLAVTYNTRPVESLRVVPVMLERLLFVAGADSDLDMRRPVPFSRLAREELVLPSPRHGLRDIVEDCAARAGISLRASVEADAFGAMIELVRNGFGCTVLPFAPIHALVASGVLRAAPLVDPEPVRRLALLFPIDRTVTPAARFVGDAFRAVAGDLVEKKLWAGELVSDPLPYARQA